MTQKIEPKTGDAGVAFEKPMIHVTTWDYDRLSAVVEAFRLRGRVPQIELLAEELDRAELIEPPAVADNVVTMHSCVKFKDHDTGEVRDVMLVYPGEEDSEQGKISIVTPVGSALLGLHAGASMTWRTMNGRTKRLEVLEVGYQPEARGFDGASGTPNASSGERPVAAPASPAG
jgi:regulator of nucleoside diphosphate kinase